MNCRLNIASSRRSARGFTMVEIAIALGVIGFALVAIIGILPTGLEVQRDNRSETIINQDANFWFEAIRSGAVGIEELPNYVERIDVLTRDPNDSSIITSSNRYWLNNGYATGAEVIGLLTSAAGSPNTEARAYVTALSGAAAEKELDPSRRELAFSYILRVVIERQEEPAVNNESGGAIPFAALSGQVDAREHLNSLYELRLTFSYPYINERQSPPRAQNFRSSVSRNLVNDPDPSLFFYFRP